MRSSYINYLQSIIFILITITNTLQPKCNKLNSQTISTQLPQNQYILSAQLPINEFSNSYLTFLFYGQSRTATIEQLNSYSTIIWLNGGPGTTSHMGNYMEIGPILINEQGRIYKNTHSWNLQYNLLFVDQPIGVGYSYADSEDEIPQDMDLLAQHFNFALNAFIQTCNLQSLSTESEWYFAGESYAGKYIPAIVYGLLKNKLINLHGVMLGNPWTEPKAIISELAPYAFNLGLIDYQERQYLEKITLRVINLIRKKEYQTAAENLQKYLIYLTQMSGQMNYYNIRKYGSYEKHYKLIEDYLNSDAMKNAFQFPLDHQFIFSQSSPYKQGVVFQKLINNICQSDVTEKLEYILTKLKVLIYNGQNDALCTNSGTQRWVNQLQHTKQEEFYQQDFKIMKLKDKVIGYKKTAGNLSLMQINDAGHVVPLDKPEEIFTLIQEFINN